MGSVDFRIRHILTEKSGSFGYGYTSKCIKNQMSKREIYQQAYGQYYVKTGHYSDLSRAAYLISPFLIHSHYLIYLME